VSRKPEHRKAPKVNPGKGKIWSDEQIDEALKIAVNTSYREASEATGIPYSTLRNRARRLKELKVDKPQKLKDIFEDSREEAVGKASEYIYSRVVALAKELYDTAELALKDTHDFLKSAKGENPGKNEAAWLKSLVFVWHNAIQSGQLLSNEPTSRPEVVNRRVYDITQQIISDPGALDLADKLLQRAANRDSGTFRLDR